MQTTAITPNDTLPTNAEPVVRRSIRGRPRGSTKPKEEPKEKRPRGRPKKSESEKTQRANSYFYKYYHAKLKHEVQCDHCDRWLTKANLGKHKRTDFCKNFKKAESPTPEPIQDPPLETTQNTEVNEIQHESI